MKNERNVISDWNEAYLNTIETLYGEFNLHPALTIKDLSDEWQECFRADGQGHFDRERRKSAQEWSESYLDDLENLYGEINLHPALTIQELCEEWQNCFMSNINKPRAASRSSLIISSKTA